VNETLISSPLHLESKIVITGAAGLVGQNLIQELTAQGYRNIVAIDKHAHNLAILQRLQPQVRTILADLADLAQMSLWSVAFGGADLCVQLHSQITSKDPNEFVRNNVTATAHVLDVAKACHLPFLVHVSSSVVISVADDDYTRTKREQEQMVARSGLAHCTLRPTLMFGWFDPKHFGWLARFMAKTPVFPIPGDGRFMRQPLYERDFCRCLIRCMATKPAGQVFDVVGATRIDYIDIIKMIKRVKRLRTLILHIPQPLFAFLLRAYAMISSKPPFTADQLKALSAGDDFHGVDTEAVFGVRQTSFEQAVYESYCDPKFSSVVLKR
jgi:nucleoside-diphosphate-sugar epimerase